MISTASLSFALVVGSISFLSWNFVEKFLSRYRVPSIIGYLGIGVLIGPFILNLEATFNFQSGSDLKATVYYLSAIALGFLIITSFTDIKQSGALLDGKTASAYIVGTIFAFGLALATGPTLLAVAPGLGRDHHSNGTFWSTVLILALAAIVTSVPFLTKIFIDLRIIGTAFASTILVSACLIDISIWAVFPLANVLRLQTEVDLIPIFLTASVTFGAAALMFFILSFMTRQFERKTAADGGVWTGIVFIILVSIAATIISVWLGAGLLLGMLIAGLSLGRGERLASRYMPPLVSLAKWIFIPTYFILVGRGLVFDNTISIYDVIVFLLWSSAIKISMVALTLGFLHRDLGKGLVRGVVFNTRGGPGLVLATIAYASDLINVNAFTAFVAASILTAPVTEFFLRYWLQQDRGDGRHALLSNASASSRG